MTTGYIDLPVEGGGSGTGNINSINGSTAANQFIVAGTGISVSSGAGIVTISSTNVVTGTPNTFAGFNNAGDLYSPGGWFLDETTSFSNVQLSYQPNNLSSFPSVFNWNVNVDPLQNSPNDGLAVHSFNANLDSASTGFNLGTSGDSAQLISGGMQYNGNGATYGTLRHINLFSNLGNGTDPFTFKGFTGDNQNINVRANTTIDGYISGFGFNLNADAAAIPTSNFSIQVLTDFSQIPIDLHGYQGVVIQPNISKIKNNSFFTGINMNPAITDFEGNAGFNGINIGGAITNQGASSGYQGMNVNPNIVHLTQNSKAIGVFGQTTDGTAEWLGIDISTDQVNTTGIKRCLRLNSNNNLNSVDDKALEVNGFTNLNTNLVLESGLGQAYNNIIGGSLTIPNGTAITGTDTICNNMAINLDLGDAGSSWTAASIVGLSLLGFVGQVLGAGTATGAVNFCLAGFAQGHTGHIDRVNNFSSLAVPTGAPGTIDEHVLFFGDMPAGGIAADHWGLRIDDSGTIDIENSITRLAINTSNKKVTNGSVGLELGSTTQALLLSRMSTAQKNALTAVNGMICYDTDLAKFQGYENGSWQNLI